VPVLTGQFQGEAIYKPVRPMFLNQEKSPNFVVNILAAALAVSNASAGAFELEEIVVTAQKHAQGVNDIGITVNAFTGDQLKDMGVSSAEDIALFTPGLTVNETAATGVPLYTIRGVGFQDYSTAASSTVGLYFDEVAMPYTVMTRGVVFDVERVEVLKGPQGDLYGRNTTAGQINFISNKPTEDFEAGINLAYDSLDIANLEGFVSGPLMDAVNARLAIKTNKSSEGWQKSLTRSDELGEVDKLAMRSLFDISISEGASVLLNVHYVQDKSDNKANTAYDGRVVGLNEFSAPYSGLADYLIPGAASFGETPPWYSTGDSEAADWTNTYTSALTGKTWNVRPLRDSELKGISAKLEWEFDSFTLSNIVSYDGFKREEANDWDGSPSLDSSNINTTDLKVFSEELRLSGETETVLWIAGLYYSSDEMDEQYHYFMADSVFGNGSIPFGVAPFNGAPILELDTKYKQETESVAVFGHVEWQATDSMRLTAGLRYTEEERDWSGCTFDAGDGSLANFLNTSFGSSLEAGACGTIDDDPQSPSYIFALIGGPDVNNAFHIFEDSINTRRWMGKLGADYSLDEDVLLYATLSQGFKSGGFNGANSNATQQLKPYDEETLTSFEFGMKATLLDNSMQLNLAAFMYDYKDKQEQDLAVAFVGNISGLTNVPESQINGFEMDMQWLPAEGFTVNLGVAYLDTNIEKWNAVDPDASSWPVVVRRDASGINLAQSPEWTYNGLLKYEWNVAGNMVMDVAADFAFQDTTTGGVEPADATDDYAIVNGRVGLSADDAKWRVLLWGRNLTDEYYYPAAYQGGNGPYVRSVGMPRTYGVDVSYNF